MSLETFDLEDLELWQEDKEPGEPGEPGDEEGKPSKKKGKGKPGKGKPSAEDILDKHMDDHEGGNEEGENMEEGEDIDVSELDRVNEHYKNAEKSLNNREDLTPEEAQEELEGRKAGQKGGRGEGTITQTKQIDISGGKAHYGWKRLISLFINTCAEPEPEETRARPNRNSSSGMYTAQQTGVASMKPGEVLNEATDARLCFVIDSSGSMSGAVADIYANINSLLQNNSKFSSMIFAMLRFSSTHEMFRAIFKGNKAAKIDNILDVPTKFDLHLDTVFKHHYGDSTNFTSDIVAKLILLKKQKYNLILFSDSDVCSGANLEALVELNRAPGGKLFIILESLSDWQQLAATGKIEMSYVSNLYEQTPKH